MCIRQMANLDILHNAVVEFGFGYEVEAYEEINAGCYVTYKLLQR